MSSLNKVMLIGNLGQDPDQRFMPDGTAVASLSLATTSTWRDKQGEKQERTEWHRVVFYGRTAEVAGEYLSKGSKVYVEGRLQTRKWQDKDGSDRYTTEVVGERLLMLSPRREDGGGDGERTQRQQRPTNNKSPRKGKGDHGEHAFSDMDDDIPFD